VELCEYDTGHAKFDLTVSFVEEAGGGLTGSVEYDTDLYDRATVDRLMASYAAALAQVAAEPERAVGGVDVVPAPDRQWLSTQGGGNSPSEAEASIVTEILARQAAATPHAVALADGTRSLTYAELDREDPLRAVAMNASFLRASLFTSVVAFGVAGMAMLIGVLFVLIGLGIKDVTEKLPAESAQVPARV